MALNVLIKVIKKLGNSREISVLSRYDIYMGVHGGAVCSDTALQAGSSRFRFPMVSLEFFIGIILTVALWPLG